MSIKDSFQDLKKFSGYAETIKVNSFLVEPNHESELFEIIKIANERNLNICCSGTGLSYADLITNKDNIILKTKKLNKILSYDDDAGLITVQSGVTFNDVYKLILVDNWYLSSCPGGGDVSIGGAVSNNVHGKDSFKNGNFGDSVKSVKILRSDGIISEIERDHEAFQYIISGIGLLGIITEVTLKLNKINSNYVEYKNIVHKNIEEIIEYQELNNNNYDFAVSWVDCFSTKNDLGRGITKQASWHKKEIPTNILQLKKTLKKSKKIYNILPSYPTWELLSPFVNRSNFKLINKLYYNFNDFFSSNESNLQLFSKYNFMHNKIPNIKNIFKPKGFIEIQPILPKKNIIQNLKDIIKLSQKFSCESLIAGLKLHKKDNYMLSFSDDGYSIGIDLNLNNRSFKDLEIFSEELFSLICEQNGKVYLAKDQLLKPKFFKIMYKNYSKFVQFKKNFDSNNLFQSDLYRRLFIE
jgi:decaprenylphospho-beta-D-ribofuranose 2-oxidase